MKTSLGKKIALGTYALLWTSQFFLECQNEGFTTACITGLKRACIGIPTIFTVYHFDDIYHWIIKKIKKPQPLNETTNSLEYPGSIQTTTIEVKNSIAGKAHDKAHSQEIQVQPLILSAGVRQGQGIRQAQGVQSQEVSQTHPALGSPTSPEGENSTLQGSQEPGNLQGHRKVI